MSLEEKILNFQKSYSIISVGEQLIVYTYRDGKTEKAELEVVSKDDNAIILVDKSTNDQLEWNYNDFIENRYNILDIVREARFLVDSEPNQVFNLSLQNIKPEAINEEVQYIQRAEYEKIYPIEEQVEDIYKFYISKLVDPSNFAYMIANKKAHSVGEMIDVYTSISDTMNNPLLSMTMMGNYISPLVRPIINDSKLVYNKSLTFEETDGRNFYVSDDDSAIDSKVLAFVKEAYKQYELSNNRSNTNKMNYRQVRNFEYGDGSLTNNFESFGKFVEYDYRKLDGSAGELQISVYKPYSLPVYDVNNSYYRFNAPRSFDAYRNVNPLNILNISETKSRPTALLNYEIRKVMGPLYVMRDNPDDRIIGDDAFSQVCRGSNKNADKKYFNSLDPDIPQSKNIFIKSISKEPSEDIIVPGEKIDIVGMVVHNPANIIPTYNNLVKIPLKQPYTSILYSTEGYWNVIDRVIQSRTRTKGISQSANKVIDNVNEDSLDFRKNNFVYIDQNSKKLNEQEFRAFLEKIIPEPEKVLALEEDEVKQINNTTDLNKILSKYFLTMKNLNIPQMKMIEEILNDRYIAYKENAQLEKTIKNYFAQMNRTIDIIFTKIYQAMFKIDMTKEITVEDVANLFDSYIKVYDEDLVKHILTHYFHLEVHSTNISEAKALLVQSFFDRYVDYIISDSPVRLILHPEVNIPSTFTQKVVASLKKYYGSISLKHQTTRIGLINEMYHNMFLKDSLVNFNSFNDYIYGLNSNYRLKQTLDEMEKFMTAKMVEKELEVLNAEINRQSIQLVVQKDICNKYQIRKVYRDEQSLMADNSRTIVVDAIFSRNVGINNILKSKELEKLRNSGAEGRVRKILGDLVPDITEKEILIIIQNNFTPLAPENITNGDWALLFTNTQYSLYQRLDNQWVYSHEVPESCRVALSKDKPVQIRTLCSLDGQTLTGIDAVDDLLYSTLKKPAGEKDMLNALNNKCKNYGVGCIPRVLFNLYTRRDMYLSFKKFYLYYDEQIAINEAIVYNSAKKLEKFLEDQELVDKEIFSKQLEEYRKPDLGRKISHLASQYMEQFQLVLNIPDVDVQYSELDKFIMNFGLVNRKVEGDKLVRAGMNESTWIYYDIPGEIVPMCCKHYLLQIKQAWKANEDRTQLQEILVNEWGINIPEQRYIFCKNCGEKIGFTKDSDFEGFDENDRAIQIREAVYEFMENEDDYSDYFKPTGTVRFDTYMALQTIMNALDIQLNRLQIFEIVDECVKEVNSKLSDLYAFESEIIIQQEAPMPLLIPIYKEIQTPKGNFPPFIVKYAETRKKVSTYKILNQSEMERLTMLKTSMKPTGKDEIALNNDLGRFLTVFNINIKDAYNSRRPFLIVSAVLAKLITLLISVYPEIKLLTNVERSSRITNLGNYMANIDRTFQNITEIAFSALRKLNKNPLEKDFNNYFNEQSPSAPDGKRNLKPIDAKDALRYFQTSVAEFFGEFKKGTLYLERLSQKESIFESIVSRTIQSSQWKTFRPILKIVSDVDAEIAKTNLADIENQILKGGLSENQAKYIAFQLSYYLFYSIQKVVQASKPLESDRFTNFCCLETLRTKYIDFFTARDPSIQKCIELMTRIQAGAFYNPSQQLIAIVGETIEVETPKLLEYIEEARRLLTVSELKKRITSLLTLYALFDGENGNRRVYSKYYDSYLAQVHEMTKQQIAKELRQEYPDWSEDNIVKRVDNLYNKVEPGLIVEDIDNNLYGWNISERLNNILAGRGDMDEHQYLLGVYDKLVGKLYYASRLYINSRSFQRIDLKLKYDKLEEQAEKDRQTLLETYNMVAHEILEDGYEGLYPGFFDIVAKCKAGIYGEKAMDAKLIPEYYNDKKELERLGLLKQVDIYSMISCEQQQKEMLDNLINQIRIEGYREDEIKEQLAIRKEYLETAISYYKLEEAKKYYAYIATMILRFKYFNSKMLDYRGFYKNHYAELGEELVQHLQMDSIATKLWLKEEIFGQSVYGAFDKNMIIDPVSVETINKFCAFASRLYTGNRNQPVNMGIISPKDTRIIIVYFIQKALLNLMNAAQTNDQKALVRNYLDYVIKNDFKPMVERNCLTNKQVSNFLRELRKIKNQRRLKRYQEMDLSQKDTYKLYRELGLGNQFGDAPEEYDEEAIYMMGDEAAQEKERELIRQRRERLLGIEVNETTQQLVEDEQYKQDQEEEEAAKEFGMGHFIDNTDTDDLGNEDNFHDNY